MNTVSKPTHLRCEYEDNPLGIDELRPRLSWRVNDARRGAVQSGYEIWVGSTIWALDSSPDLWNSGKVESDRSIQVEYGGKAVGLRQRCFWKVRTWDGRGEPSPWSEAAWWEMGLGGDGWRGKWIGSAISGGPYSIPPAPYLRKEFEIGKPVERARLYVTALGIHELEINGSRVGDSVFAPGRTEYRKRVPYDVYDVTGLLKSGTNACGAILGDGWYCGHLHSDPRQTYGDRPRLLGQLEIRFADGTSATIVTDRTWKASEGPIRSSDMLMGEDYDARLEIAGWSSAGFEDSHWQAALEFDDPGIEIVARRAPAIRRVAEVKPIAPPTMSANKRRWLFDFGQNIVGRVRMKVRGSAGQVIDLRYTEMLDKDGKPYTLALRSARATDHYTTKGGGEEIYEPRFTFHGFRYLELRDYPGTPTVDDVTGIVMHSDMAATGSFECSDAMINKLQSNIVWSQRGNFLDIPTDCPQRDERLGWTGDAQVFIRTAAFNMDVANFFTKWLQDVADSQGEDGRIPSVVPHVESIYGEGGPAWADAAIICPWTIYCCYGDERILQTRYPMMRGFMDFLEEKSVNFIRADEHWKWKGYGDWLNIDAETPADLIGTAFYAHCARLMAEIARVVGKNEDAGKYSSLFEKVRNAWRGRFIKPDGTLTVTTQTAFVLALHFDLLPGDLREKTVEALVADIQSRGMHLSTGFVGTPYLNHVLANAGRMDVAYALLNQRTFPSWLYPITQGATTMWERWDAWTHDKGFNDTGMNSFNHYAYGAIGDWMYSTIAGIDLDAREVGYKRIVIRPKPGGGLNWARAAFESVYGRIESSWRIENGRMQLEIAIPANTSALVEIPTKDAGGITESGEPAAEAEGVRLVEKTTFEVGAGRYSFDVPSPVIEMLVKE
jgi:alpha-L-rhamnosidase